MLVILSFAFPTRVEPSRKAGFTCCRGLLARRSILSALCFLAAFIPNARAQKAPEPQELEAGARIEGDFTAGAPHNYKITLTTGQYLQFALQVSGTSAAGKVLGPDNNELRVFRSRERGPTPVSVIAGQSGSYRIFIDPPGVNDDGTFVLAVITIRQTTSLDKTRLAAEKSFSDAEELLAKWNVESSRKAILNYEKSLTLWKTLEDQKEELRTLLRLAGVWNLLNDPTKALAYYDAARTLSQATNDLMNLSESLAGSGYIYYSQGDNERALEIATAALQHARSASNDYEEAQALDLFGETSFGAGDVRKALDLYQQALAIWQKMKDRNGQALALLHVGYAHSDLSETAEAIKAYDQALVLWRSTKHAVGIGLTLTGQGHLQSKLGNKQEALNLYDQAARVIDPTGNKIALASILNGRGYVFEELGETKIALHNFMRALAAFEGIGHRIGEAGTLYKIGKTFLSMGKSDDALQYFERSRTVSQAIGNKRMEAVPTGLIGKIYLSLGKQSLALKYFQDASALNKQTEDNRELAYTLNSIASIYEQLGQQDQALKYYEEALDLNKRTKDNFGESASLFNIARLLKRDGKFLEAKTKIETALQISESLRENVASPEFRSSYIASIYQQFELYIDLLMQLHKQFPNEHWNAAAFEASERGRARSLLEMVAESNHQLRKGIDPSLLEREKALKSQLDELTTPKTGARINDKNERESIEAKMETLIAQYREMEGQIRASNPHYAAIKEPYTLKTKQIQELLDSDTVALEFALGHEHSFGWAVTSTSIDSFELPAAAEIESLSRQVYEALVARNQRPTEESFSQTNARIARADSDYLEKATALSEMLLKPALQLLKFKRIVIIADGVLQYLPFAALPTPGNAATPLILDHEVINLPSASVLAVQRQRPANREPATLSLALFADPVFDRDDERVSRAGKENSLHTAANRTSNNGPAAGRTSVGKGEPAEVGQALRDVRLGINGRIPRLSFSRVEADAILAVTQSLRPLGALDFDASRKLATTEDLSRYRYLHFATHGILNSEHPELSGLLFSMVDEKGKPQNGFLKLVEIYNLNLKADLVVLSACQTALGEDVRGEGLIGLTRGFMNAGALRVVASLWRVDDAATAELMSEFYREMFVNHKSAAAALRSAQIHVSEQKRWRSPYYWAAFTIQGDWH